MAGNPDKKLNDRLVAHLRRLMDDRGWTQAELTRALGLKQDTQLHKILRLQRSMGAYVLARLHTKLGLDANRLIDEDPPARFFDVKFADPAAELDAIAQKLPPDMAAKVAGVAAKLRHRRVGRPPVSKSRAGSAR